MCYADIITIFIIAVECLYLVNKKNGANHSKIQYNTDYLSGFDVIEHRLTSFHWVGLNKVLLKLAWISKSKWKGQLALNILPFIIPVFHYTTQMLIARKQNEK